MVDITSERYSDYCDPENIIIVSPIMKLTLPGESTPLKKTFSILNFENMLKIERFSHLLALGNTEHRRAPKGSRGVPNGGKGCQMVTSSNIQLGSWVGKTQGPSGPWTTRSVVFSQLRAKLNVK